MMRHVFIMCFATLAVQSVFAFDKEVFMKLGKKCMEETNTPDEDVKKLMNKEAPSSMEAKCMLACIFKEMGILTAEGKYDEEVNKKLASEAFKDDEAKLKKAQEFSDLCKDTVNGVDDDDKGCERAAAMYTCATEKAKELGYKDDE